jgi:hypothetical protein
LPADREIRESLTATHHHQMDRQPRHRNPGHRGRRRHRARL